MSDLISRSALIEEIERQKLSLDEDDLWSYNMTLRIVDIFCKLINNQPTVEAKPVVTGEWEDNPYIWECNQCHAWLMVEQGDADMNFCPNCGADMRKKVE